MLVTIVKLLEVCNYIIRIIKAWYSKGISPCGWLHVVARLYYNQLHKILHWAAGNFQGNQQVIDVRIAIQASPLMVMTGLIRGGPFPPIPIW